jgi:SAM-dependent methyltransferase
VIPLAEAVHNPVGLDANAVWRIRGHGPFAYSDGEAHERYLGGVLRAARDLSSDSHELEGHIRDWVSEYHLSRKRSRLLRGFAFNRGSRVLEVGCGCGAITRFLGETFDEVVAVEGSLPRATLARMRTRGMGNVAVLNGPFHEIRHRKPFDIVFCIGVLEYSTLFVPGPDPHEAVLRHFSDILAPGGSVVIAIENQFGLKFFASSAEDHNNIMFDGVEGYPRFDLHRTFGYAELKGRLSRHFEAIRFHFPYPDYKLTRCVLTEEAFGKVRLGEMVGNFAPRDYSKARAPVFDQRLALMELDRNGMLPLVANSFLVVAGKEPGAGLRFEGLGVLYSDRRLREFETEARITEHGDGSVWIRKRRLGAGVLAAGTVRLRGYEEPWQASDSIQMQVLRRVKRRNLTLAEVFEPCAVWMRRMASLGAADSGDPVVDGSLVDCLWANSFVENGACVFIDKEWSVPGTLRAKVLVLRSAYYLHNEVRGMRDLNPGLLGGGTRAVVTRICRAIGVEVNGRDWDDFLELEAGFTAVVTGGRPGWRTRMAGKVRRSWDRLVAPQVGTPELPLDRP